MHFHLLCLTTLTLFLLFISPCLSSPSDIIYIRKLIADFSIDANSNNFQAFDVQFIPTATYDAGTGPVTGIPAIQKALEIINDNNVAQSSLTTQSISLLPPFDSQGAAGKATATTYAIISFIGQGADAGKVFVSYGLFKDKLVKTGAWADYGGWKFSERVFASLVSVMCFAVFLPDLEI